MINNVEHIKLLKSSNKKDFMEWQNLCDSMQNCDIYFYPQYAKLYELNNEGESCCFVCKKNRTDFVIYPFLKRRINSLDLFKDLSEEYFDIVSPYGYGGYLQTENCSIDMKCFLNFFQNYCKDNNIISEFVRFNPWLKTQKNCDEFLEVKQWNKVVAIDLLKSEEDIWAGFDSKNRNRIRKSLKSGAIVKQDLNFTYLGDFCRLYYKTMDKNNAFKYYYFDKQFFQNMIHLLGENIALFHVYVDDKIIASIIVLYAKNFAHAHLVCSDVNYLNLAPSNLLFYKVTLWAKRNQFKFFFLGGGKTSNSDDSLFRFKKRFSKNLLDFYIGRKIHNNEIYELLRQRKFQYEQKNGFKINENFFPIYNR